MLSDSWEWGCNDLALIRAGIYQKYESLSSQRPKQKGYGCDLQGHAKGRKEGTHKGVELMGSQGGDKEEMEGKVWMNFSLQMKNNLSLFSCHNKWWCTLCIEYMFSFIKNMGSQHPKNPQPPWVYIKKVQCVIVF